MGWEYLGLLFVVCLFLCLAGFYKYVYFISVGYGFSVAGIGASLTMLCLMKQFRAETQHYLLFAVLIIYGLRLASFLMIRETNKAYRATLQEAMGKEKRIPILTKVVTWIFVSALYVVQTSPAFFAVKNGGFASSWTVAGIVICVLGVVIETIADLQKSAQKKKRPDMVATKGLYRIVRCPNYFGEILFWTGVLVSSLDMLKGFGQWAMALIGYICIVFIMFNGAKRLEKRQMKRYGDNEEYIKYAEKTPIIIPLLPIYRLNK